MNDTIYRQAAIDAILHNQEVYSNNFGNDPIDKYTIAIIDNDAQTIAQLPSAQPEQRWIPCSERLPEEGCDVLVCEKNYRNIYTAYYDSAYGWITFDLCKDECFWTHLDIIAWMPLPEPYTER